MKTVVIFIFFVVTYISNTFGQTVEKFVQQAEVKEKAKDYKGAIQYYGKAIEIDSECSYAYYCRALLKFNHFKDYKGSMQDFTKVIEIGNPSFKMGFSGTTFTLVGALFERGGAKYAMKDYNGAIDDFTLLIETYSNASNYIPACYYWRAQSKIELGQTESADIDMKKWLEFLK